MKLLLYTNIKFLLCACLFSALFLQESMAQNIQNQEIRIKATDESKEHQYATYKTHIDKINLLLTEVRQHLSNQKTRENFETNLSEEIYAKSTLKCPGIQLKSLLNSQETFTLNSEIGFDELNFIYELLHNLNNKLANFNN